MYDSPDKKLSENITAEDLVLELECVEYVEKFPAEWISRAEEAVKKNSGSDSDIFDDISRAIGGKLVEIGLVKSTPQYIKDHRNKMNHYFALLLILTDWGINSSKDNRPSTIPTEFLMFVISFLYIRIPAEENRSLKLMNLFSTLCEKHDKKTVFALINNDPILWMNFIFSPFEYRANCFYNFPKNWNFYEKVKKALYISQIQWDWEKKAYSIDRTLEWECAYRLAMLYNNKKNKKNKKNTALDKDKETTYQLLQHSSLQDLYEGLTQKLTGDLQTMRFNIDFVLGVMFLLLKELEENDARRKKCEKLFVLVCQKYILDPKDQNPLLTQTLLENICKAGGKLFLNPDFKKHIQNLLNIKIIKLPTGEYGIEKATPDSEQFSAVPKLAKSLTNFLATLLVDAKDDKFSEKNKEEIEEKVGFSL